MQFSDYMPEVREISKRTSERTALLNQEFIFTPAYVAQNTEVMCWLKDDEGKMIMVSPKYTRHLGVSKSDYIGKTDSEVFGARGELFERNDRILRENHPLCAFIFEEWTRKDGAVERGLVLKKSQLLKGRITTYGHIIAETIEVVTDERNQPVYQ